MLKTKLLACVLAASLASIAACTGFLDVENPGPIEDQNLQTPDAIPSLVTGMSADLAEELDEIVRLTSVVGDELAHGGSYTPEGFWRRGIIRPEDVNGQWEDMHKARFEAESGIERIKGMQGQQAYDYNKDLRYARANLFAGLANRLLGENVCEAVINNGPAEAHTVHFSRAEPYFTEAIRVAEVDTTVSGAQDIRRAAYGGRASVRAWLGNWAGAVADAQRVPTSFVYNAIYSANSTRERNELAQETGVARREYTVYSTPWAQVFRDPRVLWDTAKTSSGRVATGQDGRTPFFQQKKYVGLGADVPLVKGTEMLMLRAEAALRAGNVTQAMGFINQARAFYSTTARPLAPLTATTVAEAWPILQRERAATLWLEGRRFWDLRRWNAEPPPIKNTFLDARDKCIPISENEEDSNPNF